MYDRSNAQRRAKRDATKAADAGKAANLATKAFTPDSEQYIEAYGGFRQGQLCCDVKLRTRAQYLVHVVNVHSVGEDRIPFCQQLDETKTRNGTYCSKFFTASTQPSFQEWHAC